MYKLFAVFAASLVLAYISDRNTKAIIASGERYTVWKDWAYIALVVMLVLFTGLRTNYNDTWNYLRGAQNVASLSELLNNPDTFNLFKVPLFNLYQSALKTWFNNPQLLIFSTALFTQACFIWFIKRYSSNFLFSVFIYFTLGTFVFSMAAMKQVCAMAVFTLAFPYIQEKKWDKYYLLIFIATLIHTFAMAFAIIPLFKAKPWKTSTFVFLTLIIAVMLNFEDTMTAFMQQINDLGKTLSEDEVFSDATINIFRLAVYAVPPAISLFFKKWVLYDSTEIDNVLIHMGIISFAFMVLGTQAGANMFGRMANYFELGTICILPTMLKKTFDTKSSRLINCVACVCFLGFFVYANALHGNFDIEYQSMSLFKFITNLNR